MNEHSGDEHILPSCAKTANYARVKMNCRNTGLKKLKKEASEMAGIGLGIGVTIVYIGTLGV